MTEQERGDVLPAELPSPFREDDGHGNVRGQSHKDDRADPGSETNGNVEGCKHYVDHLGRRARMQGAC